MSYTPLNLSVFEAAFSAAMAGMIVENRFIQSATATDYAGPVSAAGAFAQAVDTAWGANPADSFQLQAIGSLSRSFWANRYTTDSTVAHYTADAAAILAAVAQGEVYIAAQGIWNPSLLPGLVAWYRADLLVEEVGGNVSSWGDSSGNQNDLIAGPTLPTFTAAGASYNNQPIVTTDATSFLVAPAGKPASGQPLTILFVGRQTTAGKVGLASGLSTATNPIIENVGGNVEIDAGATLASALAANTAAAFYAEFDDAASRICRNNWITGGTSGAAGNVAMAGLSLGAYTDGLNGSAGDFAEVIVVEGLISAANQAKLAAYVTGRYGFAIT